MFVVMARLDNSC